MLGKWQKELIEKWCAAGRSIESDKENDMKEQRDNGSGWALQGEPPKTEKELEEIHALLDRAVNAGREAQLAKKSLRELQDHINKAETEATNYWNEYYIKLLAYVEGLPGFGGSDLDQLINPPKVVTER